MNVALWAVQVILALVFLMAGAMKLSRPKGVLEKQMPWAEDFTQPVIRFIGAMEVLAAIGLLVPAFTGIATFLVPLAAVGIALIMGGAVATHLRRGERTQAWTAIGLEAAALFVAAGRFLVEPL